jgi:hypothetical protein
MELLEQRARQGGVALSRGRSGLCCPTVSIVGHCRARVGAGFIALNNEVRAGLCDLTSVRPTYRSSLLAVSQMAQSRE